MKEQDFIQKICGYAISDMKENGVLASVTIAQAILESSWGTSELAENANNYFGMKCSLSSNSWGSVWDRVSKYTHRTNLTIYAQRISPCRELKCRIRQ